MGGLEGAVGAARDLGQHAVAGVLGEAVLGQEAVDGAIGDALDLAAQLIVGGEQLAQLGDAPGGQLVDQREQLGAQLRIVDPRRGGPWPVEQQPPWALLAIAVEVASDGALPNPMLLAVAAAFSAFVGVAEVRVEQQLDQVEAF